MIVDHGDGYDFLAQNLKRRLGDSRELQLGHQAPGDVLFADVEDVRERAANKPSPPRDERYLNVCLGMVSRPGTTVWGEILDLSEIDAQCSVSPEQAERIAAGRTAQVCAGKLCISGRVICVGIAADTNTGLMPVVVRASNPDGRIRCGVPVRVRFVELGPREGGR